jgi:hypothetical protein
MRPAINGLPSGHCLPAALAHSRAIKLVHVYQLVPVSKSRSSSLLLHGHLLPLLLLQLVIPLLGLFPPLTFALSLVRKETAASVRYVYTRTCAIHETGSERRAHALSGSQRALLLGPPCLIGSTHSCRLLLSGRRCLRPLQSGARDPRDQKANHPRRRHCT